MVISTLFFSTSKLNLMKESKTATSPVYSNGNSVFIDTALFFTDPPGTGIVCEHVSETWASIVWVLHQEYFTYKNKRKFNKGRICAVATFQFLADTSSVDTMWYCDTSLHSRWKIQMNPSWISSLRWKCSIYFPTSIAYCVAANCVYNSFPPLIFTNNISSYWIKQFTLCDLCYKIFFLNR